MRSKEYYITRFFSANSIRKQFVRGGKIINVKTDEYKKWINEQVLNTNLKFDFPVSVHISCYFGDKRKRDIDNIIKPVLDLLVRSGILKDDSLVQMVEAKKVSRRFDNGFDVKVIITECEEMEY